MWDVDDVFPALEASLKTMNDAQPAFGFELVDMSVPLDVWDLNKTEGTTFLWAEHVARRLQGKPAELGADILACVTRHWLRDNDWLYLYGWWPDGGSPPVVIVSVAGFDQLPAEGPDTTRAIANALVSCLAGFYGDRVPTPRDRRTARSRSTRAATTSTWSDSRSSMRVAAARCARRSAPSSVPSKRS